MAQILTSQSAPKTSKFTGLIICFCSIFVLAGCWGKTYTRTFEEERKALCEIWEGTNYAYKCLWRSHKMADGEYIDMTPHVDLFTYSYQAYVKSIVECPPFLPMAGCIHSAGDPKNYPDNPKSGEVQTEFRRECEAVGGTPKHLSCNFVTPDRTYNVTRDIHYKLDGHEPAVSQEFRDLCQAREDAFIIGTRCMDKNSGDVTSVIERIIDPVPPEAATAGRPENEGPQPSENETTRTCANSFPSEWWEANCR